MARTKDSISLWKEIGYSLVFAIQFLTRFPLPITVPVSPRVLRWSVVCYPLAGLVIGVSLAAVYIGASWLFPPLPAAAVVVAFWVYITGALHLDGVMDTADGVGSYRSRDRMLEIMKDSRVGAMGVIAGVLVILLKWSFIQGLLISESAPKAAVLLAIIPVISRGLLATAIAGWPYVRGEGGLGESLQTITFKHAFTALCLAFMISGMVCLIWGGWELSVRLALLLTLSALLFIAAGAAYFHSRLGGLTGDVYGALNEGAELIQLAAALAVLNWIWA
ncbi:adenosylcobinamide-GDP ribazoletransferase [Paenibacillus senegalensis]|uniref:adenosylcobinamide-GDP ribazoletransferase n=1 Tax=Paenibacillus senegalensis TaxID=1465766 RepID=UPI0002889A61|nr:adenosylcobinamide-GDP ribazoletransferase [Paenibacillus senegalensis]